MSAASSPSTSTTQDAASRGGETSITATQTVDFEKEPERHNLALTDWIAKRPVLAMFVFIALPIVLSALVFVLGIPSKINDVGNFYPRSDRIAEHEDASFEVRVSADDTLIEYPVQSVEAGALRFIYIAEDGGNVLTAATQEKMRALELELTEDFDDYEDFCYRPYDDAGNALDCSGWTSTTSLFDFSADGTLTDAAFSAGIDFLRYNVSRNDKLRFLSQDFDEDAMTATAVYCQLSFGLPLQGFFNPEQEDCSDVDDVDEEDCPAAENEDGKTQDALMTDYLKPMRKIIEDFQAENEGDLELTYVARYLTEWMVSADVGSDLFLFALATVIVWAFILFQTYSFWLASMAILQILITFPTAWFFYAVVFGFDWMTQMNLMVLFIALAVGADDCFIMVDAWKQSFLEPDFGHTEEDEAARSRLPPAEQRQARIDHLARRIGWTWRRSVRAMGVTSATTSCAFLATAISPMPSIQVLGIFAGIVIIINFLLVITFFPAVICTWHWFHCETRCCCCKKAAVKTTPTLAPSPAAGASTAESGLAVDHTMVPARKFGVDFYVLKAASELRRVERFFHAIFFPFISKARFILLGVALVLLAVAIGFASQVRAREEEASFFDEDYLFNRYNIVAGTMFAQSDESSKAQTALYWGIDVDDAISRKGVDRNDQEERGKVQYEAAFEPASADAQSYIIHVCENLREREDMEEFIYRGIESETREVRCFMEGFRNWMCNSTAPCDAFPVAPASFSPLMKQFMDDQSLPFGGDIPDEGVLRYSSDVGFDGDDNVLWYRVAANTTVTQPVTTTLMRSHFDAWQAVVDDVNVAVVVDGTEHEAPAGVGDSFSSAFGLWTFLRTTEVLVEAAIVGTVVSWVIACIILLLTTHNIYLATICGLTIACIIVSLLGMMYVYGMDISLVESLSLTVLVGLSVDYVVHLAFAYEEAPSNDRAFRVQRAVTELGVSLIGSAFTTMAATALLFPTHLLLLRRFGQLVLTATLLSVYWAFLVFLPLLLVIGPRQGQGDFLLAFRKWRASRKSAPQ